MPRGSSLTSPPETGAPLPVQPEDIPDSLFRLVAESTTVGICLYTSDRILFANRALERITGYSVEEILCMSPMDFVHPDERKEVSDRLQGRLRGERPRGEVYQQRYVTKEGAERWIELSSSQVTWRGAPTILASVMDASEWKRGEAVLHESRERMELAQEAARYVIWEWDADTGELLVDPRVTAVFGLTLKQVGRTSEDFLRIIHPEDREALREFLRQVRDGQPGGQLTAEVRYILPDGRTGWVGERARLLPTEGKPRRVIGVATDITERKRVELALAEEKERAQVTLASIGDGVIRTDAAGRIDYMNPMAEGLTGWTFTQAAGRPLMEVYRVVDEISRKPLAGPLRLCLAQRRPVEPPGNSLLLHLQGSESMVQDSASPIFTAAGELTGAVLVVKDVTQMRGMEEEVSYLVTHDPLTALVNRYEFERCLARYRDRQSESTGQPDRRAGQGAGSLIFLELRGLRAINDTCGYLAGDELLSQVAGYLQEDMPAEATLARLGGDEFAILLRDALPERGLQAARNLRDLVVEFAFTWEGRAFDLGTSVGVVHLADVDFDAALGAAEAACRLSREQGRNRVHVYRADDERLTQRYSQSLWVHRLPEALEEERFCLHRQRIQPLNGGPELCEIFIRLRDDDGGLVAPGEFIPAAERYHLIPRIDRWVADTAFHRIAELHADGETGSFAINVSGQSLGDESFLEDVVSSLEASGADPERLCFEITETAAVRHLSQANRFMSVLRGMGCRFVLDDFGSGLSSFAYLKNLQADFLKVSGEFVRGIAGNEVLWTLTRSIHELGQLLGMGTIAEGVETASDVVAVEEIGFDYAQGYYFERPGPF